jgi:hypothetical protein
MISFSFVDTYQESDHESPFAKAHWEANNRFQFIMDNVDQGKIFPMEFVKFIAEKPAGSRRKIEDLAFCRLERGYLNDVISDWVRYSV